MSPTPVSEARSLVVEVRDIVTAYAAETLPRATADQIACAAVFAEGNPMYGVEMLGLILDPGSPDVIPWRVKNAVERTIHSLDQLELRLLNICETMRTAAKLDLIASALGVSEEALLESIDGLEQSGIAACDNGVVRTSPLFASAADHRLRPSVSRQDSLRAGRIALQSWCELRDPTQLYACLRLYVLARHEDLAFQCLDENAGDLVLADTAISIKYELSQLRTRTDSEKMLGALDAIISRVDAGAKAQAPTSQPNAIYRPNSFPTTSRDDHEVYASYAYRHHLESATKALLDPTASVSQRVSDAAFVLMAASNLGDRYALDTAYRVVKSLPSVSEADEFALCRADVIYFSCIEERSPALESADRLVDASRRVKDVELACRGLRNAAEARTIFGRTREARALLYEARDIAARLQYPAQVATIDLQLADLALDEVDIVCARAYLEAAARTISSHSLDTKILRADLLLHSCWEAIVSHDDPRAAKTARALHRLNRVERHSTAYFATLATKLATHNGAWTKEELRELDALKACTTNSLFAWISQRSIAGILIFATKCGKYTEVGSFVETQIQRIEARGQSVWPFLHELLNAAGQHETRQYQ
ncbi:MAG: hypothetical protein HC938_12960 [Nitrospira sp.]|nr:hypothetical protein [Nitrospira sp.]